MNLDRFRNNWFSLSPLLLLFWSIISLLFIPAIPIASGYGWDGVFYGKVALGFGEMIGKMDSYHAGRIFPGILIYFIYKVFHLPLTLTGVLAGFKIYYVCILTLSSVIWVKISYKLQLRQLAKWIGFIALFINYPVLNFYFYYPALTDGTALLIGMLMLYAYLFKNNALLLSVTALSFFTWPTGIVIGLIIFIYNNQKNIYWKGGFPKNIQFLVVSVLIAPLLLLIIHYAGQDYIKLFLIRSGLDFSFFHIKPFSHTIEYNFNIIINALLLIFYFVIIYWLMLNDFSFKEFFGSFFQKTLIFKILLSIVFILLLIFVKKQLFDPGLPTVTASFYANQVIDDSTRFPLQFLVCHISYWGPVILLLVIYFRRFVKTLKVSALPVVLGFLFTVIFSINAESRAITNFYPFIVVAILQTIDFDGLKYKKLFLFAFTIISLLYSKIWFPVHLPATNFPQTIDTDLDKFPMQAYFMNFGLWINRQMYVVHTIAAILCLLLFILLLRKHDFLKRRTSSHKAEF